MSRRGPRNNLGVGIAGSPPKVATAVLPNGLRLEYLEQGDPTGVPVILLHGYTDSRRSWDRILPMLPSSLRVFALTSPERGRGLVLEGGFATLKGNQIMEDFWKQAIEPLPDPVPHQFVLDFQRSTLARPVPDWFFDMVVGESKKAPIQVWKGVIGQLVQTGFLAETAQIKAPTIILWGDRDTFAPLAEQKLLESTIPGSRLVVYTGTGHGMHWEEPERFVDDLVRFAAEGSGEQQP